MSKKKNKKRELDTSYHSINRYVLNTPNISEDFLKELGFRQGSFRHIKSEDETWESWVSYFVPLISSIDDDMSLTIHINLDNLGEWDDYKDIDVLDEDFGQPYYPFYNFFQYLNGQEYTIPPDYMNIDCGTPEDYFQSFIFLKVVVNRYNEEMDKLVEKGLLCKKI